MSAPATSPGEPRVVLLATGGTIASRFDPALGRTVATQRAEDLLASLPRAQGLCALEVVDFATVASFDMTCEFTRRLARRAQALVDRPEVLGVVITHGTDTMEESSYLVDLLIRGDKPVVFTGAQRPHDDPQADGPANLTDALRVAAAPQARGLGVLLCFNGTIHAARDVTKFHTSAVETFRSPGLGALGVVDSDQVLISRRPAPRRVFEIAQLEERVELFRLSLGASLKSLEFCLRADVQGLVIEGFGRGNAPSGLTPLVREAVGRGVAVLMTSRCPAGRVQPIYGGGGGGRDLADAGALFVGDLKGPKARLLLMVLLSVPETRSRLAEILAELAP